MVSARLGHLTDAEIAQYVRGNYGAGSDEQRVESHLAECGDCLQLTVEAQRTQLGFLKARKRNPDRYPDCPAEEAVAGLVTGYLPENSREIIRHVAQCDFCGPLLEECRQDFSENLSPAEEKFLSGLKTSQKDWQRQVIEKYVLREDPGSGGFSSRLAAIRNIFSPGFSLSRWAWAFTGTTALLVLSIGIKEAPAIVDMARLHKAKNLVITAASEQPTLEMRLPNAGYAHFKKPMQSSAGGSEQTPSWMEANHIVQDKKKKGALNREWLQVEGLTSLLDGTPAGPSKATIAFEKALADGLDDPSLEIELAASYFESDKPNIPRAIELLEAVLSRPKLSSEERKTALYDLAIAYESISDWRNAVEKWDEYLRQDSSSDWAKEARIRRDKAKPKIPESKPPDPRPSSFLGQPSLQARVEEYLEIALAWLPRALQEPESDESRASATLAELLATQHSDPFLRDFMKVASSGEAPAFEALKAAVLSNKNGAYGRAEKSAQTAATIFALHHNLPGELYAEFEEVMAEQQEVQSNRCAMRALQLERKLAPTSYLWLKAHTALERATCLNQAEDAASAIREVQLSEKLENNNFPVLRLRILGLKAGVNFLQNKDDESWQLAIEGLRRVEEGTYPLMRAYQFYIVLEQYAQRKHYIHAQLALLRQAITMLESAPPEDQSVTLQGALYARLSAVYLALNEEQEAGKAAEKSNLLLSRASHDEYVIRYITYVKINLAAVQLDLGRPEMAVLTLEPAREMIADLEDKLIALEFYRTLGDGYRKSHRLDQSSAIYESGIVLAERMLSSSPDESSRLKWINGIDPVYRGLVLVLLEQGRDEDALKLWEWYGGRSGQVSQKASARPWDVLQRDIFKPIALSDPHPRFVYAVFEDRLQIWTEQARSIKGRSVKVKQSDLEKQVNDYARECAGTPKFAYSMEELRKAGEPLSTIFLQPVRAELEAAHSITVELDPKLSRLPVAALMTPAGHYLGNDYAITISPGRSRESSLRRFEMPASGWSMLVATGASLQGRDRLPGQADLVATVQKTFAATSLYHAEHDPWNETSRRLKSSDVFLFFGHGTPEGNSTVLVYGNTLLNARSFPPESLQGMRLAVLAACSSGTGGESALQETGSLVHAFLAGGVPGIIVTRWNVDSEATSALLECFFTHLSKGEDPSEAMYHARTEFRNKLSHPDEYRHPYYWAGLELIGQTNQVL